MKCRDLHRGPLQHRYIGADKASVPVPGFPPPRVNGVSDLQMDYHENYYIKNSIKNNDVIIFSIFVQTCLQF